MSFDSMYRGWPVATGCFLGIFVVFGVTYSFGVFLSPIQEDLGLSRSGVSLIFSLQTGVLYVAAGVVGIAADRYGVRRLLLFGTAVFAGGMILTVFSWSFATVLLGYGVLTAIGLSAAYVVSYATVPRWFGRRRGLATGLASSGVGVGMVAISPAADTLIRLITWRGALLSIAICSTIALIVAMYLIRESPIGHDVDLSREFPAGYPDADAAGDEPESGDETSFDSTAYRRELWALVTSRRFLLVFAGWVGIYATMYVVFVHLVAHTGDVTGSERVGMVALTVVGLSTGIARIVVGGLSDRIGRIRTFIACSFLMAASTIALIGVDSLLGVFAFAVVFGAAYGGNGALLSPLTANLFGSANPNAVFGLVSLSFAVSGVFAPWGAGIIYDIQGAYTLAFLLAGTIGLVGSGLVALAGRGSSPAA